MRDPNSSAHNQRDGGGIDPDLSNSDILFEISESILPILVPGVAMGLSLEPWIGLGGFCMAQIDFFTTSTPASNPTEASPPFSRPRPDFPRKDFAPS